MRQCRPMANVERVQSGVNHESTTSELHQLLGTERRQTPPVLSNLPSGGLGMTLPAEVVFAHAVPQSEPKRQSSKMKPSS